MVENVIQIRSGTTAKFNVSTKIQEIIICGKKIIFGIPVHVLMKMIHYSEYYLDHYLIYYCY